MPQGRVEPGEPRGERLAAVSADGRAYRAIEVAPGDVDHALAPDGTAVAWLRRPRLAAGGAAEVRLRDLSGRQDRAVTLPGPVLEVERLDWFPDSRRLLVAGVVSGGSQPQRLAAGWGDGLDRDRRPVVRVSPALWEVDRASGRAALVCTCGFDVQVSSRGVLAQAPKEGTQAVTGPVPSGTVRLPAQPNGAVAASEPGLRSASGHPVLVKPDGTAWAMWWEGAPPLHGAGPGPEPNQLRIATRDGTVRGVPIEGSHGPWPLLLAWTDDGILLTATNTTGGADETILLVDPRTGRSRRLASLQDGATVAGVATGVVGRGPVPAHQP